MVWLLARRCSLNQRGIEFVTRYFNLYKPSVLFMDIGKQDRPRCDAAERGVPSGAILLAILIFIENGIKMKKDSRCP